MEGQYTLSSKRLEITQTLVEDTDGWSEVGRLGTCVRPAPGL